MVYGFAPLALAAVLTLGINGLIHGSLSPATSGSAGMLFGLGIDGVVLLFLRYLEERRAGASADEAVSRMSSTASSVVLAQATTAATFLALLFVDFPTLQDLGSLVGLGILLCCGLTLLLLPALLPRRDEAHVGRGLTAAWLGRFVTRAARPILWVSLIATIALAAASTRLRLDTSIEKLQAETRGTLLEKEVADRFSLPQDVLLVLSEDADIEPLLETNARLERALATDAPSVAASGIGFMLPSAQEQSRVSRMILETGTTSEDAQRDIRAAGRRTGFRPDTFDPFLRHLPQPARSGRADFVRRARWRTASARSSPRFIVRRDGRYRAVTYLYPRQAVDIDALGRIVSGVDPHLQLTGLPVIDHDVRRQFVPQFLKGIAIGTIAVAILIYFVFRTVRHTLLALVPTVAGFAWSAGLLALAGIEVDLFSLFAAVTFIGIGVDYGIYVLYRYVFEPSSEHERCDDKDRRGDHDRVRDGAHWIRHARPLKLRPAARVRHRVDRDADLLPGGVRRVVASARPRTGTMVLCALTAAFNEEAHVAEVVRGTARHASPVVVVDDGSTDGTAVRARDAGAIVLRHEHNRGKGCAIRTGLEYALTQACSHVVFLDADLQHDPDEIPLLVARAEQGAGDFIIGEREFKKDVMPAARYYSNVIGSAVLSRFIGAPVMDSQSGFRLIRANLLRSLRLTATGYEIETEMLIKLVLSRRDDRSRDHSPAAVCRGAQQDPPVPGHVQNVPPRRPIPVPVRLTRMPIDRDRSAVRWHSRTVNNGLVFGATFYLVTRLPRGCSYAIGHAATWLAYQLMRDGTRAIVENLRVVRPDATEREVKRLALLTYRSYGRDTIDFIRSLVMSRTEFEPLMAHLDQGCLDDLLKAGRGVVIVGGHFGNWELGGVALRLLHGHPLTVIGKAEASPVVGEIRRRMRESLGIETLEIGQTVETALQIRRLLAANGIVAMLLDRHVGRDRVDVAFFGRPTGFLRTPAMIGYLSGAPLLPAFMIRQADGRFVGTLGDPIVVDSGRGRPRRRSKRRLRRSRLSWKIEFAPTRSSGISSIRTGLQEGNEAGSG